jgi:hypothetical protein
MTAAERAVISDDGVEVRLTLYVGECAVAWIKLPVVALVGLAADCSVAASRGLSRERAMPQQRRRGGDALRDQRKRRNEALCDLGRLVGAELSLEQQAARIVAKAVRYRPAPDDRCGGAERQALLRLATSGLPLPGRRQVRRILAKQNIVLDGQTPAPRVVR